MALFLEVDGQVVGEVRDFKMDDPPRTNHWGPIFVHQRTRPPDTCVFTMPVIPPMMGSWVKIVEDDGTTVHEIKLLHLDTKMGLGSSTTTVKAKVL